MSDSRPTKLSATSTPPVKSPLISPSQKLSRSVSQKIDEEIDQLLLDIRRIQPEGEPWCKFGPLFDDPDVEQYYEALVGTLKSAKKKGFIKFPGQMLLKGMHDNVKIEITQG